MIAKEISETAPRRSTNRERYGTRDLTYNNFHRQHYGLGMIDIDQVEVCLKCSEPLALVELAMDVGQSIYSKKAFIMKRIAERLNVPAFVVMYRVIEDETGKEITGIRCLQVAPVKGTELGMGRDMWIDYLYSLHEDHEAKGCPTELKKLAMRKGM